MSKAITVSEWRAAVQALDLQQNNPEYRSVEELSAILGCGPTTVRSRLRTLKSTGHLDVGSRTIETLSGKRTVVPCYRLKK